MNANETAKLAGISVRTLHHYDRIGLLRPVRRANGYREYGSAELDKLQQILFFKACGFSLERIKELLSDPAFDAQSAFALQEKALLHERGRIDAMLDTLRKTRKAMKGEGTMSDKEKFAGFDFSKNPYEQEARERWGDDTVDKSNAYWKAQGEAGQKAMQDEMNGLFARLGELRHEDPASGEVQGVVGELYAFFNKGPGSYTPEMFAGLGQMYVADERFTRNIDRFGEGLSAFLEKAMGHWAQSR